MPRHPLTDIVIFPEGWWHDVIKCPPVLSPRLLDVCMRHQVYVVLGSGIEAVEEEVGRGKKKEEEKEGVQRKRKNYVTSLMIGPDGKVIGRYRKRVHPGHHPSLSAGKDLGLFPTRFGTLGVLICFDIENEEILSPLLAERPWLILNPVHIPAALSLPPSSSSSSNVKGPPTREAEARRKRQWAIQMKTISQKFERMSREYGFVLVRCDSPQGAGTSQVIAPSFTYPIPLPNQAMYSIYINRFRDVTQPSDPDENLKRTKELPLFASLMKQTDVPRSKKEENCGERYFVMSAIDLESVRRDGSWLPPVLMTAKGGSVLALEFLAPDR